MAGYSLQAIRAAGYVEGLKSTGCSCTEARRAGYGAAEARLAGYTPQEIYAAGYTCLQARQAGFTCAEARETGYSLQELKQALLADEKEASGAVAAMKKLEEEKGKLEYRICHLTRTLDERAIAGGK